MSEAKPFASLSSGLLARKGAAKPAMRSQGFGQGVSLEDLGWNDMGDFAPAPIVSIAQAEPHEHVPSSIAALTPSPRGDEPAAPPQPLAPPPVVEQRMEIEARLATIVPDEAPPRAKAEPGSKSKAAFTLRLDAERHLKLRLACAVKNRSAQKIVSEALDAYLATLPELDSLARHVPGANGKRG